MGSLTGELGRWGGPCFVDLVTYVLSLSLAHLPQFFSLNYKCPPTLGSGDGGRNAGLPLAFH